jgi:broad specificity phosphatase PhoE
MTRLWLVRHGPTHAKAMIGWTDLPADLSDTAALARLSDHLPDAPILTSDLSRAMATADAIAGDRPRLPADRALREIHFGDWENRRFDDIDAEAPAHIRTFWETPGDIAPPGGESWNALRARVNAALDTHLGRHADLIVVCHFGPILTQVERALGLTTVEAFAQKIEPLSVTDLTWRRDAWTTGRINHRP